MRFYHEFEQEVEIIPVSIHTQEGENQLYIEDQVCVETEIHLFTDTEAREAAEMFGELEDDQDVEEFEAWIDGLQSTRYFEVRQAVETLRMALADYQKDLDMERLLRAIRS